MRALLTLLAILGLAGCGPPPEASVEDGWVRLPAVRDRPAAAYFELHGGAADATLLSVTSSVAIRSEMHESMAAHGTMSMRPIDQLAVPARAELTFAPGGRHVMLFGLNPAIKPGSGVPLRFTFADGKVVETRVPAVGAGDPQPD